MGADGFARIGVGYARAMSTDAAGGSDYRADQDPDADPEMKEDKAIRQPDQAEGADDRGETNG